MLHGLHLCRINLIHMRLTHRHQLHSSLQGPCPRHGSSCCLTRCTTRDAQLEPVDTSLGLCPCPGWTDRLNMCTMLEVSTTMSTPAGSAPLPWQQQPPQPPQFGSAPPQPGSAPWHRPQQMGPPPQMPPPWAMPPGEYSFIASQRHTCSPDQMSGQESGHQPVFSAQVLFQILGQ